MEAIYIIHYTASQRYTAWLVRTVVDCKGIPQGLIGQHLIPIFASILLYFISKYEITLVIIVENATLVPYHPDSKIHGAHLGPVGPMWAPCWPHKPCYHGSDEYSIHEDETRYRLSNEFHRLISKARHRHKSHSNHGNSRLLRIKIFHVILIHSDVLWYPCQNPSH